MLDIFMYALIIFGAAVGIWALWNENAPSKKDENEKDKEIDKEIEKKK